MPPQRVHLFLSSTGIDGLMCAQQGGGGMRTKIGPFPFLQKAEGTFPSPPGHVLLVLKLTS